MMLWCGIGHTTGMKPLKSVNFGKRDKVAKPLREQARAKTRAKLVTAGATEFALHGGVQGARVTDIAKRAGVAAGTFYTHFEDKEVLFVEVMENGTATVLAGLKATQGIKGDQATRDRAAMEGVVGFAEAYGALFRIMLSRGSSDNPMQQSVMEAIVKLRKIELKAGQEAGMFRQDLNPELAARTEVGAVFHLLDWWIAHPKKASREEIISTLMTIRRFGVEGKE